MLYIRWIQAACVFAPNATIPARVASLVTEALEDAIVVLNDIRYNDIYGISFISSRMV